MQHQRKFTTAVTAMHMTLDISDWKLKVFEKRKLESLRYFRIWKPELGYYGIFIAALLLNWFWTPSFLLVLDNCRLILPPTLFQVLLTFLKLCRLLFSLLMFSPFVETLKTPFNRKWRRRHFREGRPQVEGGVERGRRVGLEGGRPGERGSLSRSGDWGRQDWKIGKKFDQCSFSLC